MTLTLEQVVAQPLANTREQLGYRHERDDRSSNDWAPSHLEGRRVEKGAKDQALGRSRGGLTTKIHRLAEALERPLRFIITASQVGDVTTASALVDGLAGGAVLDDKTYDSHALRRRGASLGAAAVIPSNRTRKILIPHDATACKRHNCIERCFNRLRHFRRFATRYDRRTVHFTGFIHLSAAMIRLR